MAAVPPGRGSLALEGFGEVEEEERDSCGVHRESSWGSGEGRKEGSRKITEENGERGTRPHA
jgi:hypothetical protein